MDLLFQVLFTFLFEGCFEIINDKDINIFIRKIILAIMTLFYISLILIFIHLIIKSSVILVKIFLVGIIIFIVTLFIRLWVKIYRNKVI